MQDFFRSAAYGGKERVEFIRTRQDRDVADPARVRRIAERALNMP